MAYTFNGLLPFRGTLQDWRFSSETESYLTSEESGNHGQDDGNHHLIEILVERKKLLLPQLDFPELILGPLVSTHNGPPK